MTIPERMALVRAAHLDMSRLWIAEEHRVMGRESRAKDEAYRRGALASLEEMERAIVTTYGAAVWEASEFYALMQRTRDKYKEKA